MHIRSSIRSAKKRDRKLQVVSRKRNKAGKFLGHKRVTMRDKMTNGKTGRYAVTQG